jgi:hypothetical protein
MKFYKSAYLLCLLLIVMISLASDPRLYIIESMDLSGNTFMYTDADAGADAGTDTGGSSVCGNIDCTNIGNMFVGNVDCSIYCNILNAPSYSLKSPTANVTGLSDASYNALIKYDSNNFMLTYHEDISMNPQLAEVIGTPVYGDADNWSTAQLVPSYVDSVLLSRVSRNH